MEGEKPRWQQVLYIVAPFFLLLACFTLINLIPGNSQVTPEAATKVVDELVTAVSPANTAVSPPTSTPQPTVTPAPTATLPPDAVINLLGPPEGGRFRQMDTITFYADLLLPLEESQRLALYIRLGEQPPQQAGSLDEANAGQVYRWQLDMSEIVAEDTAVTLDWWVQLQTDGTSAPLLTSSVRQITLLP